MQTEGGSRCTNFFESLILILLKYQQKSKAAQHCIAKA